MDSYTKGFVQGYCNFVNKNNELRNTLYKSAAKKDAIIALKKLGFDFMPAIQQAAIGGLAGAGVGALGSGMAGVGAGQGAAIGALAGSLVEGGKNLFNQITEKEEPEVVASNLPYEFAMPSDEDISAYLSMQDPNMYMA